MCQWGLPKHLCATIDAMAPTTISQRLREARRPYEAAHPRHKPTARAFAALLKISSPSLHDLESGESKRPRTETLMRLRAIGISVDYVIHGIGPPLLTETDADLAQARRIIASLDDRQRRLWMAIGLLLVQKLPVTVPPAVADEEADDSEFAKVWERSQTVDDAFHVLTGGGSDDATRKSSSDSSRSDPAHRRRRKA